MPEKILTEPKFSVLQLIRFAGIETAVFGCALVVLGFVLVFAQDFVVNLVEMAMTRYGNSTGKIALNMFAEDRQLMRELLFVRDSLLPLLSAGILAAFLAGFPLAVLGICTAVFPSRVAGFLSNIHWMRGDRTRQNAKSSTASIQKKSAAIVLGSIGLFAALLVILCVIFGGKSSNGNVKILEREAKRLVELERDHFRSKGALGTWEQIGYEPAESDLFAFEKDGNSAWKAVSRSPIDQCPAGSVWRIGFDFKGLGQKAKTYTRIPKDSNCVKLTPEFHEKLLKVWTD